MDSSSKRDGYLGRFMKRVKDAAVTLAAKEEPGLGDLFRAANAWVTGDRRPYPRCSEAETGLSLVQGVQLSGLAFNSCRGRIRLKDRNFIFEPVSTGEDTGSTKALCFNYPCIRDIHMPVQFNASGPVKLRVVLHTFHTFTLEIAKGTDALALFRALVTYAFPADDKLLYRRWINVDAEVMSSRGHLAEPLADAESGLSSGCTSPTSVGATSDLTSHTSKSLSSEANHDEDQLPTSNSTLGKDAKLDNNEKDSDQTQEELMSSSFVNNASVQNSVEVKSASVVDEGCGSSGESTASEDANHSTQNDVSQMPAVSAPYQIDPPPETPPTEEALNLKLGVAAWADANSMWEPFDISEDYVRMFANDNGTKWRDTKVNSGWEVCDTYPEILFVPRSTTDAQLRNAAQHRAKGRFPVLSYCHKNGAVILRCAQPLTGLNNARNFDDEALVVSACKPTDTVRSPLYRIIDARPMINAIANMAGGKGYETWSNYGENCRGQFLEIDNIHAMRSSLNALVSACAGQVTRSLNDAGEADYTAFFPSPDLALQIDKSKWLFHVGQVLLGADAVVHAVTTNESVLVHCSDGWDRTSQITSLAELMLDPFYRSYEGFKVLIKREWLAFGHKFEDRLGRTLAKENEASPIFVQFLDCVWQLMLTNSNAFEFNPTFLVELYSAMVSGSYGTFLGNSEKSRVQHGFHKVTKCLWKNCYEDLMCHRNQGYKQHDKPLRFGDKSRSQVKFFAQMYLPFHFHIN